MQFYECFFLPNMVNDIISRVFHKDPGLASFLTICLKKSSFIAKY